MHLKQQGADFACGHQNDRRGYRMQPSNSVLTLDKANEIIKTMQLNCSQKRYFFTSTRVEIRSKETSCAFPMNKYSTLYLRFPLEPAENVCNICKHA